MKYFKKKQLLPIPQEVRGGEPYPVLRDVYYREKTFSSNLPLSPHSSLLRSKGMIVFSLAVAMLAAASALGFYFFVRNPDVKFGEEMVNLTMTLPSSIATGAPFTAVVHYQNHGTIALTNAILHIVPSAGFVPDTPHTGLEWEFPLGTLDPFTQGERELPGILLRQAGTEGIWRAVLTFKPAGFGAEFRKSSFASVMVTPPWFITSIDAPVNAIPGKPYSFTVRIKNPEGRGIPNLGVMFTLPQGVTLQSADPVAFPAAVGSLLWTIENLPSGTSWEGTSTLMLPVDFVVPSEIPVTVGTTNGSELITLEEHRMTLGASAVLLGTIKLGLNGATSSHTLDMGDTLRGEITITNPLDHDMTNLTLQVEVGEHGALFLDWDHMKSAGALKPVSADQTSGKITHFVVSSSRFSEFSALKPGKKVIFTFTVPILGGASFPAPLEGTILSARSEATLTYQDGGKEVVIVSNPVVSTLNSNLSLEATARYVDDTSTRVRIPLVMKNTMHELSALSLEVVLGSSLVRADTLHVDAGEMRVDDTGRRVVWSLNRFPLTVQEIKGAIDLVITPSSEKAGKGLVLIDSFSLSAVDVATGGTIHISRGAQGL